MKLLMGGVYRSVVINLFLPLLPLRNCSLFQAPPRH